MLLWYLTLVSANRASSNSGQGLVSRESRKLFGPEKPFVKLRPAYSVKLVFSYVVKRIKIKITAKFRDSRHLRFQDTKRIMSPEMLPKSFGTKRNWPLGSVSRTVPRGLFLNRVPKVLGLISGATIPFHLCNAEVLSHQTSQYSWFFLH